MGKAVKQLKLPQQCVIAAILRKGELIIPHGDLVLQQADEVIAIVHKDHAIKLAELLGDKK